MSLAHSLEKNKYVLPTLYTGVALPVTSRCAYVGLPARPLNQR